VRLPYTDHRADPAAWARELGISREAVELYLASDVIDLHIDSFIWHRVLHYDLTKRHTASPWGARFFGQVDFPRVLEAGIGGATWVITTNPLRDACGRRETFFENLTTLRALFDSVDEQFAVVRNAAEYRAARALGKHGAFIGIQGGNALDAPGAVERLPDGILLRVTLIHLTSSRLGTTSAPHLGRDRGLSRAGRELIEALALRKIFVDLAHLSKASFWNAVDTLAGTQPLLVTHTGIDRVHASWRNLDDDQLRAVADSGGTIGIMYHSDFLEPNWWSGHAEAIVRHIDHVVRCVGDDHVSLGSDWDGAIVTPRDMPTCLELPRLVELMLRRGHRPERVQKILGGNFLRVVSALRG
jgi:membrane dipeptidase